MMIAKNGVNRLNVRFMASYKHPKHQKIEIITSFLDESLALDYIQDFEKTGRFNSIIIEDDLGQQWNVKEFKKLLHKTEGQVKNISVLFDASYNKHSRESGLGWIIEYDKGQETYTERENRVISGLASNNEAEYASLYYALKHAIELSEGNQQLLEVSGDSLVVINQMSGEWPCYDQNLVYWIEKVESLLSDRGYKAAYRHITRKGNKKADKLSNQALQDEKIKSKKQRND